MFSPVFALFIKGKLKEKCDWPRVFCKFICDGSKNILSKIILYVMSLTRNVVFINSFMFAGWPGLDPQLPAVK